MGGPSVRFKRVIWPFSIVSASPFPGLYWLGFVVAGLLRLSKLIRKLLDLQQHRDAVRMTARGQVRNQRGIIHGASQTWLGG